ncbi:hypothetical protein SISSUDRAFT_1063770 [Sistotremastrum suecicum HHB10207 ss-3]|uniref:Uncharacterized protein n=1 Tax=Sistotremastrum suecicum HHB10207 ss-3 TaxID=1314776 RepID=A0A166BFF6_9AGAM|nr:hypothetical protein SISSUDRAFT_1063770 [Sistotremastrum suecicum HHB10207 ss-3]
MGNFGKKVDAPPNAPVPPVPQLNIPVPHANPTRLWGYLNYIPEDPPRPLTPTVVDEEDLMERLAELEPVNAGETVNGVGTQPAVAAPAHHAQPAAAAHAPQFLPAPPHLRGLTEEEMNQLARKNNFAFCVLSRPRVP